eukprot:PhF_6_TR6790/c0_g1_i1/m.9773
MWFQSSFRQLSNIQSRQVGVYVGASIADGAIASRNGTRIPFAGYTLQELKRQRIQSHTQYYAVFLSMLRALDAAEGVFVEGRFHTDLLASIKLASGAVTPLDSVIRLRDALASGDVISRSSCPDDEGDLEALAAAIPIVALYPYASDEDIITSTTQVWRTFDLTGARAKSRHVLPSFYACCSVLGRYMCQNPKPILNTGLSLPEGEGEEVEILRQKIIDCSRGIPALDTSLSTMQEHPFIDRVMTTCWEVTAAAKSFEHGMEMVLSKLDGKALEGSAIYVGGLLGAKFGARALPLEWLENMPDGQLVGSLAVTLSQYAWNPNQRGAGKMQQVAD